MNGVATIDSLLLDLDGTLVDSLPGIEFSISGALAACDASATEMDLRMIIGPPVREMLATISGRSDVAELDALEKNFRAIYDGGAWQKAVLYPQVRETLAALAVAGVRLFVVTNKPRIPAERLLAYLEILGLFTAFYSPDQRQPGFRDKAEAARQAHADWSLDPARTLLVGDSRDDAHAAASCGCRFAGVEFGYGTACTQSDFPVHMRLRQFGDLISILSGELSAIH